MSGKGAEELNEGEAAESQELIGRDLGRRIRTLSRKALENAVGEKRGETNDLLQMLIEVMRSAREITEGSDSEKVLRDLVNVSREFRLKLTKVLLKRMNKTAAFSENDNVKLQEFADLCADVERQLLYLPGLACLNFPNAIQQIAGKLPPSLGGNGRRRPQFTRRETETSTLGLRCSLKLYRDRQK